MKRKNKYDESKSSGLTGLLFEPPGEWSCPTTFPDLSSTHVLGIDIESHDPNLKERGPGFLRGDAKVVGISLSDGNKGWYFPIGHLAGGNMDAGRVINYVRNTLIFHARKGGWIVGANLQYELEGLNSIGITLGGKLLDVQVAEALLDEESVGGYSLENLCKRYLGESKDEKLLREAASAYGVDPKSELWKLHSKYVGAYAEFDAMAPIKILEKQMSKIQKEDLEPIFELESQLLPVLWEMRKQGIPVDLEAAKQLSDEFKILEDDARYGLHAQFGYDIDEWSGQQIARCCDVLKINYPRTARGNPSFIGDFLENSEHPFLKGIATIREYNRLRSTFIDDWIFKNQINGWIHPQWKQLAQDDGGTRTGRMAAANPNPQQVPARSDLAPKVRALFRAPQERQWCKLDYSQQEPRLLVHFASLCDFTGAKLVRMKYQQDPKMDIYQFLAESTGMSRRDSKDATLGRCYGMGSKKFADKQGISLEMAKQKLEEFDKLVPFVREIADSCANKAKERGYIRTLLGRRRHFNFWEPVDTHQRNERGEYITPLIHDLALQRWPNARLQRAGTHKALNCLIQGSAADMTKKCIIEFAKVGMIPYMAVHDETDCGVESEKQAKELQHIAEYCVEMTVPIRADMKLGEHW